MRSIAAEGGNADAVAADLTQPDSISALNAAVEQKFGGLDILINNVGGPPAKPISAVPIDEWRREFDAMVGSVLRVTGHFLPGTGARKWGRIHHHRLVGRGAADRKPRHLQCVALLAGSPGARRYRRRSQPTM